MNRDPGRHDAGGYHISGSTTSVLVRYVRRTRGDDTVRRMLQVAGVQHTVEELEDITAWISYQEATALFDAAVTVTGDPDVARSSGQELLRQHAGTEVAALLRSLGSPGEVLRNVAAAAAKYSTVSVMETLEVEDDRAIVAAQQRKGVTRHPHFCRFTEGVLSQAPLLFGMEMAWVEELECQAGGASRCSYRVVWDPEARRDDPHWRIATLEAENAALTARFETLQQSAVDLTSAQDVESALAAIANRAGLAVRAPQFVLAVRDPATQERRVHSIGVAPGDVADLVDELLEEDVDDHDGTRLVADITRDGQLYGRLAAVYPDGVRFFPQERRLLEAYASHASAALAAAASLEQSRHRDRTARTLLDLAHALSEATSEAEVGERTVDAALAIIDCDQTSVWLWDRSQQAMVMSAGRGISEAAIRVLDGARIVVEEVATLAKMVADPSPVLLLPDNEDALLRELLAVAGSVAAIAVPIIARDHLSGVIVVGVTDQPSRLRQHADLLERMNGIARQAATALQVISQLERAHHEALHDAVTRLPNQRLLRDRAREALADRRLRETTAALLFIDLDGFKQVNDTLGHSSGDELLALVGERLERTVRDTDTVARVGGDEFAVMLPCVAGTDEALDTAARILRCLEPPFTLEGATTSLSASIGVALHPDHGRSYDDLIEAADAAMYRAKKAGRARVELAAAAEAGPDRSLKTAAR